MAKITKKTPAPAKKAPAKKPTTRAEQSKRGPFKPKIVRPGVGAKAIEDITERGYAIADQLSSPPIIGGQGLPGSSLPVMKEAQSFVAKAPIDVLLKEIVDRGFNLKDLQSHRPEMVTALLEGALPRVEQQVAQRALIITEESTKHVTALKALKSANVLIERAAMSFRDEVIKAGLKEAHDLLDPMVEAAKRSYDMARAQREKALEPFETADMDIRQEMANYLGMLNRLRAEEQRKAQEDQIQREVEASKQRATERARVQAKVDAELSEVAALVDAGQHWGDDSELDEIVRKIESQLEEFDGPMPIAPTVQVSAPETSKAMTLADNLKAKVTDVMAVAKQVIAGILPESLLEISATEANRLAKLYYNKDAGTFTRSFEGLEFYNQPFARGVGGRR